MGEFRNQYWRAKLSVYVTNDCIYQELMDRKKIFLFLYFFSSFAFQYCKIMYSIYHCRNDAKVPEMEELRKKKIKETIRLNIRDKTKYRVVEQ